MFGKNKEQKNTNEIGFEERERKTLVLGYVLLIAMAIVTTWLGFLALNDLDNVPQKPEALSTCANPYLQYEWQDAWHKNPREYGYPSVYEYNPKPKDCIFSKLERKYKIDETFNESKELRDEIKDLKEKLRPKESELNFLKQNYQLGLTEKIAKAPDGGIYKSEEIAQKIKVLEKEVVLLRGQLSEKELKLKPYEDELKDLYAKVQADLKSEWRWHDFYSFLLQGIFVFPLFFFLLRAYFRLSAKNSPYLIIFTFLLIPVSLFILKIVFVYFWGLFLGKILEVIWNFIKEVQILKSLISYFGMILAATVFGGAVYFLQKKIFDPKRVAQRHLRDKKCPNCSFSLDLSKNFCSNCGHKIMEKCENCGKNRYSDLPVCQYCQYRKL
jgi:hypothetical protein